MQEILHIGPSPETADGTLVLIHGRGATAGTMRPLYEQCAGPNIAALAPQASGNTWYPYPFMSPLDKNQPHLDEALKCIDTILDELDAKGVPLSRIALCGFSQGACLVAEYALRHPQKYGVLMILSGGYIGPDGGVRKKGGSFEGTPVFIGVSDPDPHIPFHRAQATADLFSQMEAETDLRRYHGYPHTIKEDEIEACRTLLQRMIAS